MLNSIVGIVQHRANAADVWSKGVTAKFLEPTWANYFDIVVDKAENLTSRFDLREVIDS